MADETENARLVLEAVKGSGTDAAFQAILEAMRQQTAAVVAIAEATTNAAAAARQATEGNRNLARSIGDVKAQLDAQRIAQNAARTAQIEATTAAQVALGQQRQAMAAATDSLAVQRLAQAALLDEQRLAVQALIAQRNAAIAATQAQIQLRQAQAQAAAALVPSQQAATAALIQQRQAQTQATNQLAAQRAAATAAIQTNSELTSSNNSLTQSFFQLRSIIALLGIRAGVNSLLDANIQLQAMENAFAAISGKGQGAANEIAFVRNESERLGLEISVVGDQYSKLLAAGKTLNISQAETRKIFSSVSEAGIVLGLTSDQVGNALTAIQQIMSKGTVQAEELRRQLGNNIPGAFGLMAQAVGKTEAQLNDMLKQGALPAKEALIALADALHTTYGAQVPEAVNATSREIARLKNEFFDFRNAINDAGFIPKFLSAMSSVTVALRESVQWLNQNRETAQLFARILIDLGEAWAVGKIALAVTAYASAGKIIKELTLIAGLLRVGLIDLAKANELAGASFARNLPLLGFVAVAGAAKIALDEWLKVYEEVVRAQAEASDQWAKQYEENTKRINGVKTENDLLAARADLLHQVGFAQSEVSRLEKESADASARYNASKGTVAGLLDPFTLKNQAEQAATEYKDAVAKLLNLKGQLSRAQGPDGAKHIEANQQQEDTKKQNIAYADQLALLTKVGDRADDITKKAEKSFEKTLGPLELQNVLLARMNKATDEQIALQGRLALVPSVAKSPADAAAMTDGLSLLITEKEGQINELKDEFNDISANLVKAHDEGAKKTAGEISAAERQRVSDAEHIAAMARANTNEEAALALAKIRSAISNNDARTDISLIEKEQTKLGLLQQEQSAIQEIIRIKQQEINDAALLPTVRPDGTTDTAAKLQQQQAILTITREIVALQSELTKSGNEQKAIQLELGTVAEKTRVAIQRQLDAIGSVNDILSRGLVSGIQGVFSGLHSSITGLINRTMTLKDALLNVASSFVNAMVDAFAKMAVEYIEQKGMMFVVDQLFAAKGLALSVLSAGASLIAWIPAAIASSIASFGSAAAIGTAAAIAAIVGASGGFYEGGYTGGGNPHERAGDVHKGEFVFPHDVVARVGPDALYRMMDGIRGGASFDGPASHSMVLAPSKSAPPNVSVTARPNVVIFDDQAKFEKYLQSTQGQGVVLDLVSRRRRDLGQPT